MKTEAIALFLENDKPWPAWFGWLEHRPVTKQLWIRYPVRTTQHLLRNMAVLFLGIPRAIPVLYFITLILFCYHP